jgi:hypothetical protein
VADGRGEKREQGARKKERKREKKEADRGKRRTAAAR